MIIFHLMRIILFLLKNLDPYFEYLEVGSYEENSAIFIANNFDKANIYCVDSWKKTNEYKHQNNFSDVKRILMKIRIIIKI